MKKIEVTPQRVGRVLEQINRLIPEVNYNYAAKLLRNKDIRVGGVKISENILVKPGEIITVFIPETRHPKHFEVVFEDGNLIIVNKKKGIETTGDNSLESEIGGVFAVSRLDRNTEGLVIFAKSLKIKAEFVKIFRDEAVEKYYLTEVLGHMEQKDAEVSAYLVKDEEDMRVKIYRRAAKGSIKIKTGFKVLKETQTSSVLLIRLFTGKTHQIRAHLAYLGNPILGDGKYGKNDVRFSDRTQKLFCHKLKFAKVEGSLSYLSGKEFTAYPTWFKKSL